MDSHALAKDKAFYQLKCTCSMLCAGNDVVISATQPESVILYRLSRIMVMKLKQNLLTIIVAVLPG